MKFGKRSPAAALGSIVAHSIRTPAGRIRKGQIVDAAMVEQLQHAGIDHLVCASLDGDDVHEDRAAARLARAIAGPNVSVSAASTGRANLHADVDGLLSLSRHSINAANAVDEGVTVATLAPDAPVVAGRMIATVKIIPFAIPERVLTTVMDAIDADTLQVHARRSHTASLIQTRLPGQSDNAAAALQRKMRDITEQRLLVRGVTLCDEQYCEHDALSLAAAMQASMQARVDWILIIGASAISDRRDIIPEAIERLGGEVAQFGMPVDPGNLTLVARLEQCTVLGLPGCARSPALNGLDAILDRLSCKLPVDASWLRLQGVGGLLGEVVDRPKPRVRASRQQSVAGLLLAAGESRRAGQQNKLLYPVDEKPMIAGVARLLETDRFDRRVLVTGHEHQAVERACLQSSAWQDRWQIRHNPTYRSGMATSLVLGVSLLNDTDGVIVFLADMPDVDVGVIDALLDAFAASPNQSLFIPTHENQRGNPVLIAKSLFDSVLTLEGDTGARVLAKRFPESVVDVAVDCPGVLVDYDTPEALASL